VLALLFGAGSASADPPPAIRFAQRLTPANGTPSPLADARGRVPIIVDLPQNVDARSLGLFEVAPGIGAARLPLDRLSAFGDAHPGLSVSIGSMLHTSMDKARKWDGIPDFTSSLGVGGTGDGVIVGIVDTGIDITHPGFQDDAGQTRIAWLITWGEPKGLHPELEDAYGCTDPDQAPCAIYAAEDLQKMIDGETTLVGDVHDTFGHGTHVASLAAGNGRTGTESPPKYIGIAPNATLVIAAPTAGGGFSDDGVLRGTKFIFDRADEMGMAASVNLSIGGDFGPHDGTSALEKGLAAMVGDDQPGRALVVAAGNSGGLFKADDLEPLGIHTEVHVDPHAPARASILVPGDGKGQVFVWVTFRPGDEVSVGLDGPDGRWIGTQSPGNDAGYDDGDATAGVINNVHDGTNLLNADTNSAYLAWSGQWSTTGYFSVVLEGSGDAQLWVAAQGEATNGAYFLQAVKQGTINTPASAPKLLSVGCTINRHAWKPYEGAALEISGFGRDDSVDDDSLCYFSAGGPNPLGVAKPEIVAPGAFVAGAMSYDVDPVRAPNGIFSSDGCPGGSDCYVVAPRYAITTGTSMSAPQVTGAAALMMEQRPDLTQAEVTAILQASARRPSGKRSPESAVGPGALDLRHALEVLASEPDVGEPPVLGASWWVLSAESARPDRTWPVWGTIELRRDLGQIATGLDGSLLGVEVDGGAVISGVTKVKPGLFRFAVAGNPGAGGDVMRVRVTYDGVPFGEEHVLPIAIDAYAVGARPTAVGGCDCTTAGGEPAQSSAAWLVPAALGLASSRRLLRRRSRRATRVA